MTAPNKTIYVLTPREFYFLFFSGFALGVVVAAIFGGWFR